METFENEDLGIEAVFDIPCRSDINLIVSLADYLVKKGHSELFITRVVKTLRLISYLHTLHINGKTVDVPELSKKRESIKIGWSKRKVNKLLGRVEVDLDEVQYITLTKMCDEYKDSIDPYESEKNKSIKNFTKTSESDIIELREEAKKIFGWKDGKWLRKNFEDIKNDSENIKEYGLDTQTEENSGESQGDSSEEKQQA